MGPLHGVKVVEMGGLAPGPYCAMMLADMGADVLRIERPDKKSGIDARFLLLNRNRRAIAVDLKSPHGIALVRRLITKADALIEGFRPGVMERLGLGPERCMQDNTGLVYGRMTGWGQEGPLATQPGHDINYIALSGALACIGTAGSPPSVPLNLVGDFGGGGMLLAFGIACALIERGRSGLGQVIDAAMIDGASSMMTYMHGLNAAGAWGPRGTNVLDGSRPHYTTYETSDGQYVSVGASEQKFFDKLIELLNVVPVPAPGSQRDSNNWPALKKTFAEIFKTRTRSDWCKLLEGADVCFAPEISLDEAPHHPHHIARKSFVEVAGIVQPAPTPRFSRTPASVPMAAIEPGQDLKGALQPWGLSQDEIESLRSSGVVS
jgi:alpha-methylacyl-CoA racemase